MSDTVSCEDLSDEIIEDLKIKGLLNFVVFEQSSNSAITVMVYDNEKYRPIVREWGSAIGIHIFPPLDRRPFTDDLGKHSIRYVHTKVPLIKVKANRKHFYFYNTYYTVDLCQKSNLLKVLNGLEAGLLQKKKALQTMTGKLTLLYCILQ